MPPRDAAARCCTMRASRDGERTEVIQADGQRKELQRITSDNKRLYRSLQVRIVLPVFYNEILVQYIAGDQTHCAVAEANKGQREGPQQVCASVRDCVPVEHWHYCCVVITFQ